MYSHGSKYAPMQTFMEVGGRRVPSIKISMEVGRSRSTSMGVGGSFHGKTWKFLQSVEVESSIASIHRSFDEYIPTSFHELSYSGVYT